jgi:plasmid stabilization system protein ParE
VKPYTIESYDAADADIEAAFDWYQAEQPGLGLEFLDELRATYHRMVNSPLKYQELRSDIRRALMKRFPYAIYFAIQEQTIVVVAVLHTARDPAEWQWRL